MDTSQKETGIGKDTRTKLEIIEISTSNDKREEGMINAAEQAIEECNQKIDDIQHIMDNPVDNEDDTMTYKEKQEDLKMMLECGQENIKQHLCEIREMQENGDMDDGPDPELLNIPTEIGVNNNDSESTTSRSSNAMESESDSANSNESDGTYVDRKMDNSSEGSSTTGLLTTGFDDLEHTVYDRSGEERD